MAGEANISGVGQASLWGSVLGAGIQAYGAYSSSRRLKESLAFQAEIYENNKQLAIWAAHDARRRGTYKLAMVDRKEVSIVGKQRTSAAARGVSGPGQDALIKTTRDLAQADKVTVTENTNKEALDIYREGLQQGVAGASLRARASAENAGLAGATSALGSFGQVADRWYRYRDATAPAGSTDRTMSLGYNPDLDIYS